MAVTCKLAKAAVLHDDRGHDFSHVAGTNPDCWVGGHLATHFCPANDEWFHTTEHDLMLDTRHLELVVLRSFAHFDRLLVRLLGLKYTREKGFRRYVACCEMARQDFLDLE
jgi:hypothetical protein